jgi:short-subunit dehydrogenase
MMNMDLTGQRVLVTGASSGIGAALAERFAAQGAVVGITARRQERLAEVLERCHARSPSSRMWTFDLADPAQVDELARVALTELGGIDVLVNNAGIPKRRHVTALDAATAEHVMRVNYHAPVRLTLALLPHMLGRGTGTVVQVSSVAAKLAPGGESAYAASKAALSAFAESMAVDLWGRGVSTLVVYPGVVDTELFHLPDNDPPPFGLDAIEVDELVDRVMEALAQGEFEVYVPDWFAEVATSKAADTAAFLAAAAAWAAERGAADGG